MMARRLFLGVDGGGSKTAFLLIDGDGRRLAQHLTGASYHVQIGLDGVRALLAEGVGAVLAEAGVRADELDFGFFGLPAYGEDAEARRVLQSLPAGLLGHERYACANDMVCGWAGSLAGADGINIVAGTGSIGYGERRGRSARVGGWGTLIGDEGSAYWIAVRALTLFSRMSDGRAPRGALYEMLRAELRLTRNLDLCAQVTPGQALGGRDRIAALCPVIARAAEAGDAGARAIFAAGARELAEIADAVREALGYAAGDTVPLSHSGGVFAAGEAYRRAFEEAVAALPGAYALTAPILSPLAGAALLAARRAGTPLEARAIQRLRDQDG
jgi:N-acetylglucosamine kinase-like BadF-type ATPase